MAKGFTVKASKVSKTKKGDGLEWDYDAIKARMKGKTIVFCLPGRGVSYTFLKNFVQLCFDMVQNGMSIQISQDYSSMVNFCTTASALGANVLRGPDQIPWDGKLNYDWQLWIDSDIIFNTEKFWQLLMLHFQQRQWIRMAMKLKVRMHPISAGWYSTEDGKTTSVAHWLDEDDFRNNGGVMNHEMVDGISQP